LSIIRRDSIWDGVLAAVRGRRRHGVRRPAPMARVLRPPCIVHTIITGRELFHQSTNSDGAYFSLGRFWVFPLRANPPVWVRHPLASCSGWPSSASRCRPSHRAAPDHSASGANVILTAGHCRFHFAIQTLRDCRFTPNLAGATSPYNKSRQRSRQFSGCISMEPDPASFRGSKFFFGQPNELVASFAIGKGIARSARATVFPIPVAGQLPRRDARRRQ